MVVFSLIRIIFPHKILFMRRQLNLILYFSLIFCSAQSQLKSPDDFLGYKIGQHFTPHWKIAGYFNHVAANSSSMMQLKQYGETNEGRPLLLAFISSPENIRNLESIRQNNIKLANLSKDKTANEDNAPAIVWLSYNVHGNEPSSSEAAMMTLFALVNPANSKTKEWLKNTVVVIDPCINPDGRDRYVNWFNSAVGKNNNVNNMAREHREPWPQGRTNHYNFDLNRDWAWQTQVESRERLKVYLSWMPEVHVDFHEQGINEPYYFAPAAEPFHEVITAWQREFQNIIGKNNAKYFDENNWLYFTKIRFDLFYPSYGDTYPLFNGSIGMTYEQGGINAGLGVLTDDGDTLTLLDRVTHHYTTSLSTIEAASLNAGRLIKEFHKYFDNAVTSGMGEYKSFVIKYKPADEQRYYKLLELLDKNGIQYSPYSGSSKGYNYETGKEGSFTGNPGDLLISSYQPRGAMVQVLFEPRSKLVDSVTYDITAWSLPYVYGLTAFASKEKLQGIFQPTSSSYISERTVSIKETNYGYVMPWLGVRSARTAGQLLQKGIVLRYAETPFEINGKKFERGSIIILKTSNKANSQNFWQTVRRIAYDNNIQLEPVSSGMVDKGVDFGGDLVHPIKAPRVVMFTGDAVSTSAAGGIWSFFEQELDYPLTQINVTDFSRIDWNEVDVLIMPDGNYRFLNEKESADDFKSWIRRGGRVIALEGAMAQLAKAEIGFKLKKEEEEDKKDKEKKEDYDALKKFEDRERDFVSGTTPGSIYRVDLDNTNPIAFGYPNYYYTLKQDDRLYEFLSDGGWNVGVLKKDNQVAGFVGNKLKAKLKDGLLFGIQTMGSGSVTGFSDDVLFRNFWENGKLMFCNAIFLVK